MAAPSGTQNILAEAKDENRQDLGHDNTRSNLLAFTTNLASIHIGLDATMEALIEIRI